MQGAVDQLDPVLHRRIRARLQVADAANVGRDYASGAGIGQAGQLAANDRPHPRYSER